MLDVGFQFYCEIEVVQNLLKLLLMWVVVVDGVGIGFDDVFVVSDVCLQGGVVEMVVVGLVYGVVEVLYIGEDSDFFCCG